MYGLWIWFKIHTNVSNFETATPKPYKLLNFCTSFVKLWSPIMHLLTERSWDENHYVCPFHREITKLNMIFHVVVPVYQFVKIWNLLQFPAEFWNSQLPGSFFIYQLSYYYQIMPGSKNTTVAYNYLSTCITKTYSAGQSKFKVLTIKLQSLGTF